jgi:hypothetical protein
MYIKRLFILIVSFALSWQIHAQIAPGIRFGTTAFSRDRMFANRLSLATTDTSSTLNIGGSSPLKLSAFTAGVLHVNASGVASSGNVLTSEIAAGNLTIGTANSEKHLIFSRGSLNYIAAPASGGFAFLTNGASVGSTSGGLYINSDNSVTVPNGFFGIGVTTAIQRLHVENPSSNAANLILFGRQLATTHHVWMQLDRQNNARSAASEYSTNGTINWVTGLLYSGGGASNGYGIATTFNLSDAKFFIDATTGDLLLGTTTDDTKSRFTVVSTTQGSKPVPAMTQTQRDAISSPSSWLQVICTDCTATDGSTGVLQVYNGSAWKNAW